MTKEVTKTVTLEEKGKITINVQDDGGNAVSGASVTLSGTSSDSTTTDSSGQVVFDGLPVGQYDVTISKSGYFEKSISVAEAEFE